MDISIDPDEGVHIEPAQASAAAMESSTGEVEQIPSASVIPAFVKGDELPQSSTNRSAETVIETESTSKNPKTTTTTEEQREERGNAQIHINLDEYTHVRQAQPPNATDRQRRRAERRSRNRIREVIDLTDESGTSRMGNITEMFSDGNDTFVRRRVWARNEVVTIASDDEQEVSPVNLAGQGTSATRSVDRSLTPHPIHNRSQAWTTPRDTRVEVDTDDEFEANDNRPHPLHIPIGLDYTIGTEAWTTPRDTLVGVVTDDECETDDEEEEEEDDDGSLLPNDHLSDDGENQYDTDGIDPLDEGGIYNDSEDEEVDERPSTSTFSAAAPPTVAAVSSTEGKNAVSIPPRPNARTARQEIVILDDDDDDGIPNTRPSPPRTPPPRLSSTFSQVERSPQLKCSVCLDIPQLLSYTDCGHVYCEECIRSAVKINHKCPVCRKKMTLSNIRIMQPLLQFDA